jgi:hypothetical protein
LRSAHHSGSLEPSTRGREGVSTSPASGHKGRLVFLEGKRVPENRTVLSLNICWVREGGGGGAS